MDHELKTYLDGKFARVDGRFAEMDGRLDKMDGRLDKMDGRLDKMDGRLAEMDGRLDKMDGRLDQQDRRLDERDRRFDEFRQEITASDRQSQVVVEGLRSDIQVVAEGVALANRRLERYQEEMKQQRRDDMTLVQAGFEELRRKDAELDHRLTRLESAQARAGGG